MVNLQKKNQIHDIVNNNLQNDYRETRETERRRAKIHGQKYFGDNRAQFMGKRKSRNISQAARQSKKNIIISVIEDNYQ